MRNKSCIYLLLIILTVIVAAFGFTSCSEKHVHDFSEWETLAESTCSSHGMKKRVCECGFAEYEPIELLAHTPVIDPKENATCVSYGKTEGSHCSVCNAVIEPQHRTELLGHSFSDWETVAESTCSSHGMKKRVCECGFAEYEPIELLAHTPVIDPALQSTCIDYGRTEGSHCSECGIVLEPQIITQPHGHVLSAWETVAEASCTSHGLKKRVCECGFTDYATVDAADHKIVTDPAVAATCTEYGKTEGCHCETCGAVLVAQEIILPTGHKCDRVEILTEATCKLDGEMRHYCTNDNCGYYYDESYPLEALEYDELCEAAVSVTGKLDVYDRYGNKLRTASAVVISADGLILTVNFITDNAFSALFTLNDTAYEVGSVVTYSEDCQLIVMKIDAEDLPYAEICEETPTTTEPVYAAGAYGNGSVSLSKGVVTQSTITTDDQITCVEHDAHLPDAHIGGPLFNRFGKLIGINAGELVGSGLSASIRISEMSRLEYGEPISMEEYGRLTHTPTEQLRDWILYFGTSSEENIFTHGISGSDFSLSIGYDKKNRSSFVDGYWSLGSGREIYVRVYLNDEYNYYATYAEGGYQNKTYGFIDAAAYDENTVLTYDTYEGKYWDEASLMELYSEHVCKALFWLSYCVDTYFEDLTLEDLGFEALSYGTDDSALEKLNAFVEANGSYEETTGSYVLFVSGAQFGKNAMFSIIYTPASENAPSSTVVSADYYGSSSSIYRVSVTLDPTELGNRFDALYAVNSGNGYVIHNSLWGYIEADTFTDTTKLSSFVTEGLDDYEDALLSDYAFVISALLDFSDLVMKNVSPELSVRDLGFLFFQ